jgi:RNA polymerase sigma-70 factor (ECF subfamily)
VSQADEVFRVTEQAFNFEDDLVKLIPQLRAYAFAMTRSRESGDDLVQDALVRALRSQHTFTPGTNLKAWVFTILRHQFITVARRKQPIPTALSDTGDDAPSPAAQEDAVSLRDFHRLLQQLPPKQREALLMIGANGFTYEEAAAITHCSVGTIKSRVSRARAFLLPHFAALAPNAHALGIRDQAAGPAGKPRRRRRTAGTSADTERTSDPPTRSPPLPARD